MTSTAIYRSMMMVIEARRLELGLSMEQVNDRAGTQDGYYAKMIYPDTPSGRQATWPMVEMVVQALFGRGFSIAITPAEGTMLTAISTTSDTNEKARVHRHWRHRDHYRGLSAKAAIGRAAKISPNKRSAIARKAAHTRWKRERKAKRQGEKHKATNEARKTT